MDMMSLPLTRVISLKQNGRTFNQNWGPVSSDYTGKQYWYMYGVGGLFGGGNQPRYNSTS